MMLFQNSVSPVTLATCFSVLLMAEAKPYGGMMPSAPIVDASPWMPIAQPNYYSGGYNSYQPSYRALVAPLQTPSKSRAYSPTAPKPEAPAPASQSVQPNPATPEAPAAPAASPWFQPPQISEAPAPAPASQWVQPNPTMQEAPATNPWVQPAAQNSEAPAVSQWAQPNPIIPEVPAAIPSASQQWAPAGATPVVPHWMRTPNSSPMSPPPPVADPTADVPAITSPQPENTPIPQQPESAPVLPQSPPIAVQPENGDANVIFNSVQVSVPAVQGPAQDNWPETPRMVPEADNLPALPPATFGQFAVQPAR